MVDATLHVNALRYPTISAQNNRPLKIEALDSIEFRIKATTIHVEARRASTSDPWTLEMYQTPASTECVFAFPAHEIKSDSLDWKSMADLSIKQHLRLADAATVPLSAQVNPIFSVADATQPCGRRVATTAEVKTVFSVQGDDAGNFQLIYTPQSGIGLSSPSGQLSAILAAMLAATTQTSFAAGSTPLLDDSTQTPEVFVRSRYTLKECQGTDALSIGNFATGEALLRLDAAPAGGYGILHTGREIDTNKVAVVPTTHLDHIRRASKDNLDPYVEVEFSTKRNTIFSEGKLFRIASGTDPVVSYASMLNPDGIVEMSFDQSNSMNVLAAAAFAGLAGLASVGVATELRQLLEQSPLSALFQQVAVALGSTTAAVVTGYVSAIIAAYTNGWITNEQLFDLNQHVAWLGAGAQVIAGASAAGVGILGVGGILSYLGVSTDITAAAIAAAGGAAAGAGVALGMCSIMAKVVRHRYWGE